MAANVLEHLIPSVDFSLFDGAMEFLVGDNVEEEDDVDEEEDLPTPPSSPMGSQLGMVHVSPETLPLRFCYERRHVQTAAVGLQTNNFHKLLPHRELESYSPAQCYTGYFTLTMRGWYDRSKLFLHTCTHTHTTVTSVRGPHTQINCIVYLCVCVVLSDGVMLDVIFFPATPGNLHWKPLPLTHDNTWESVLSHGGFSSHAPPPSPGKNTYPPEQLIKVFILYIKNISSC